MNALKRELDLICKKCENNKNYHAVNFKAVNKRIEFLKKHINKLS